MRFLVLGIFTIATLARGDYPLRDYGRDCARELGVPVPRFNCLDPNATEIPVTVNGRRVTEAEGSPPGGCDTPGNGFSGCMPGARLLKYVDYIRRGNAEEKVVTTILCRRATGQAGTNNFWETLVIQHNETNNRSCYFGVTANRDSSNVPPPYPGPAENFWGRSTNFLTCTSCHESQPYIRTPWIKQVADANGGYVRRPGDNAYRVGNEGNGVPDVGRRGPACPVGLPNVAERFRDYRPAVIKINRAAYERFRYPQGVPANTARVDTCTRCHYLGRAFTCGLIDDARGEGDNNRTRRMNSFARRFPNRQWMPPRDHFPPNLQEATLAGLLSPVADVAMQGALSRGYENYFGPAIEAAKYCCQNATAAFCQGTFPESPDARNPCPPPPVAAPVPPAPTH